MRCAAITRVAKDINSLERSFGTRIAGAVVKTDMWPKFEGIFVRSPPEHDSGDEAVPDVEAARGR